MVPYAGRSARNARDPPRRPRRALPGAFCPDGAARPGQRLRPEARQRALAHGFEIDPDGRERGLVKAAEDAAAPEPHQLLLDSVRPQAVRAQHGGGRVIAADQREQQMLAAQVAVPEPDRVLEPAAEDRPGAGVIR